MTDSLPLEGMLALLTCRWGSFAKEAKELSEAGLESRQAQFTRILASSLEALEGETHPNPLKSRPEDFLGFFPSCSGALQMIRDRQSELESEGFEPSFALHFGECLRRSGTLHSRSIREIRDLIELIPRGGAVLTEAFRWSLPDPQAPWLKRRDRHLVLAQEPWTIYDIELDALSPASP